MLPPMHMAILGLLNEGGLMAISVARSLSRRNDVSCGEMRAAERALETLEVQGLVVQRRRTRRRLLVYELSHLGKQKAGAE